MPPSSDFVLLPVQLLVAAIELLTALIGLWVALDAGGKDDSDDRPNKKS